MCPRSVIGEGEARCRRGPNPVVRAGLRSLALYMRGRRVRQAGRPESETARLPSAMASSARSVSDLVSVPVRASVSTDTWARGTGPTSAAVLVKAAGALPATACTPCSGPEVVATVGTIGLGKGGWVTPLRGLR